MNKKLFKKPALGRVHLKMSTSNARQVLTIIGPVLAEKLSVLLGGVAVSPLVTTCKSKPGFHRLLFNVPEGIKLPKGVDTLPIKSGEGLVRVTTFPLEAISLSLYGFFEKYGLFFVSSKIDAKGNIFLRFDGTEDQVEALSAAAKKRDIKVLGLGEPKRGQKKLGIYLVSEIAKASKPKRKAKPKPKSKVKVRNIRKVPELANPDSVRLLLSSLTSRQKDLIISKFAQMHSKEFFSLVKGSASSDVTSPDPESKRKGKPSGIELEKVSLN